GMIFTDITATCGLFTADLHTYGMTFGDIDNDGDLDVFIANRDDSFIDRNYLYRNDAGTFVEITASAGISLDSELSFCTAFFDYDNDGDQDIYLANDKHFMNRLYQNDGAGNFTDVSVSSGAGIVIDAMSTTIGDYDNDGWFDIYVTNTFSGNYFLRNNQDGTFTNLAPTNGTEFFSFAWGAVFFDADLDADLDLYVSSSMMGQIYDGVIPLSSALYENDGTGNYTIPPNIGFDTDFRESYANAVGDYNNDGLPDIVVMNDTDDYFLWENTSNTGNNYLKVNLEGTISNRDGIGSKIEIAVAGDKQYRYTLCGEGYISQNSGTEFFGVGTATTIDYVKVTWLSGTVDMLTDVAVNQTLNITEGSTLSVSDFNSVDVQVYPNPTSGQLNISNLTSEYDLTVLDITGKELMETQVLPQTKNTINLSSFSKGLYMLRFENDKEFATRKVVLEHSH
ncbi:MAG: FG-GAP-like repeat-containing protein, partial [Saprospiraceae bacterium]|nr:FG-GAP-like repeat-containing protein [Saprospiraceae bacterium]